MNKAFFIDRDGTINVEIDNLSNPEQVEIIPGVAEALKLLRQHGFKIIIVTNQAGIAHGLYSVEDMHAVHKRIRDILGAEGAEIDDIFYCPHHENPETPCTCRKPNPGMILEAAAKYNIDCRQSVMVGDRLTDIAAGRSAGCRKVYLVKTGSGKEIVQNSDVSDILVADDLLDAVRHYLSSFSVTQ